MNIQKQFLVAATALLMSSAAWADAWYIRGDFGYSWVSDDQSTQASVAGSPDTVAAFDLSIDPVPLGQLGFGYVLEPYLRFDVTGSLTGGREVTLKCSKTASACSPSESGNTTVDTSTLFANVYYEMASLWTQGPTRWHPYIGLGLGSAYQSMSTVHTSLNSGSGSFDFDVEGNGQWQFAWRTMLGLAVTLTDNLLLDMSYVYMGAGEAESGTTATFASAPYTAQLQKPLSMDMNAQEVYIGLRQQF